MNVRYWLVALFAALVGSLVAVRAVQAASLPTDCSRTGSSVEGGCKYKWVNKRQRLDCANSLASCTLCFEVVTPARGGSSGGDWGFTTVEGTVKGDGHKYENGESVAVTQDDIAAVVQAIAELDAAFPDGPSLEHDRQLAKLLGEHGFLAEEWAVQQDIVAASYPAADMAAIDRSVEIFITLGDPEGAIEYRSYLQQVLPVWQIGVEQTGAVTVDPYANWRYDASVENLELAQAAGLSRIVPVLQDNLEYYAANLENSPADVVSRLLVMPGQ